MTQDFILKTFFNTPSAIIAPPPFIYLSALSLGIIFHLLYPVTLSNAGFLLKIIGIFFLSMSGIFAYWAFATMRSLGTSPDPRKPSTALSTHGAFAYSRNPIYVAMTGLYLGISLIINSLWLVLFLIPTLILMQWGVIVREERYLTEKFGQEYIAYTQQVRRWL